MNLQQLRIVRETLRQDFNLTEVANVLFTAQSGVSRHIKELEDELGLDLYIRRGKRLIGLTEPGKLLIPTVERILQETENLRAQAKDFASEGVGELVIATTHTQARYALPTIIAKFRRLYPKVQLKLHQGSPDEIKTLLRRGEADIGIATEGLAQTDDFTMFPFYIWRHVVITPKQHPLLQLVSPSLKDICQYPIITYHEGFTGRSSIEQAFLKANLEPNIVMTALDADVIKSYVELEMGVGIIAPIAFDGDRDSSLDLLDAPYLFKENTTQIALLKGRAVRSYVLKFLQLCRPDFTPEQIAQALVV